MAERHVDLDINSLFKKPEFSLAPKPEKSRIPTLVLQFMSTSSSKLRLFSEAINREIDNLGIFDHQESLAVRSSGVKKYFEIFTPNGSIIVTSQRLEEIDPDPEKAVRANRGHQPSQKFEATSFSQNPENKFYVTADVYLRPYSYTGNDPELGKPEEKLKGADKSQKIAYLKDTFAAGRIGDTNQSRFLVSTTASLFYNDNEKFRYTKTLGIEYSNITDDLIGEFVKYCKQREVDLSKISGGLPTSEWIDFLREKKLPNILRVEDIDALDLNNSQVMKLRDMLVGSYPPGFGEELLRIVTPKKIELKVLYKNFNKYCREHNIDISRLTGDQAKEILDMIKYLESSKPLSNFIKKPNTIRKERPLDL